MAIDEPSERSAYLEERKLLIDAERDAAQSFDKALITLGAGALGLSITFIHEIAPHPKHEWILACAWALLGLSLLAILTSFLISQSSMRRARDIMDERERRRVSGGVSSSPEDEANHWSTLTLILNAVALVSFIAGVGFFAAFTGKNLP